MKVIAFYLPQFHPIPENDQWWGKGFTEWTNVTRAKPLFADHYQPRLPADLGFYDLRLPEIRLAQARLAGEHGIHGFCYHYYWFNGKKLLDLPLREMLASKQPDLPFCLCYANENWTRRWDGQEQEILIKQDHSKENDRHFIQDVLAVMQDHRYIKVNGRPLLVVYRAQLFPDPVATTTLWREEAEKAGFDGLYLCKCQTFGDDTPPAAQGFDAAVEFPPHGFVVNNQEDYEQLIRQQMPNFQGRVFDYRDVARHMMIRQWPEYPLFKTVMLAWDNSARARDRASIFHHFSPDYYERWLGRVAKRTTQRYPEDERLVFINAWNEWAEGTYLEPDQEYGNQCLLATERAIRSAADLESIIGQKNFLDPTDQAPRHLSGLGRYIEHRDTIETLLVECIENKDRQIFQLRDKLKKLEAQVAERDKIISTVYATRGWWVLSKLSNFHRRIEE
jgi:lipopolysaccharide biosynthesis protein